MAAESNCVACKVVMPAALVPKPAIKPVLPLKAVIAALDKLLTAKLLKAASVKPEKPLTSSEAVKPAALVPKAAICSIVNCLMTSLDNQATAVEDKAATSSVWK